MEAAAIRPPDEVLVNRFVRFIDEVAEVIKERGDPPLGPIISTVFEGIPPCERSAAIEHEMSRYRTEVELPAEEILRERKASRPSAVEKVVFPFSGYDYPDFYCDALEGIETHLLQVADPPKLTSLALRVSWPRNSSLRNVTPVAFISSADRNLLVLYVGTYRPCPGTPGFYLVYDAWAISVAVIPPLPSRSFFILKHRGIGSGVAVLRHGLSSEYLLAELVLGRDRGRILCKGTLFMWWSSGPAAGRWTQKEVMLPLPSEREEEHRSVPTYNFFAHIVFAVGNAGLCWVDLLQGILLCDDMFAAQPQFCFIELPMASSIRTDIEDLGEPVGHRSMCCVERHGDQILKFVAIDGYGQSQDHSRVTFTTWILPLTRVRTSKWEKSFSFSYGELQADPSDKPSLLMPGYPLLSMVDDNVVYITTASDLKCIHRGAGGGQYVLCLDMKHRRVLSSFRIASGQNPMGIFASIFSSYLHKKSLLNKDQQKSVEETSDAKKRKVIVEESVEETSDAKERKVIVDGAAQLDIVVTDKLATTRSQEDE